MSVAGDIRTAVVPYNRALYAFYIAGFVVVGGGFVLLTSGADLRIAAEPGAGSIVSQSVLAFFYCIGGLLLIGNRHAATVLTKAWPVLLLPLLAIVSVAWSPEPMLTLRRAFAFAGTTIFGLSLGAAYPTRDTIGLIIRGLTLACLFSIAIVVVDPWHGLHQSIDAVQAVHAGLWRGIFGHRNTLGLWASVAVAAILFFGRYGFGGMVARGAALAIAVICLVGANSGAGYATLAFMVIATPVLSFVVQKPPGQRMFSILLILLVGSTLSLFTSDLTAWALEILGKQSDLTGRTLLWYYILQMTDSGSPILGSGYFAGFLSIDAAIDSIANTRFGSAHNGYIETFVYLGSIGLLICIGVILWLLLKAVTTAFDCTRSATLVCVFPASIALVVVIHNFVESTIVLPNNLNSLLVAILAGMLALPTEPD
jgi:exopolysaccharide production protein ExoQ